jgi:hypothetical protein
MPWSIFRGGLTAKAAGAALADSTALVVAAKPATDAKVQAVAAQTESFLTALSLGDTKSNTPLPAEAVTAAQAFRKKMQSFNPDRLFLPPRLVALTSQCVSSVLSTLLHHTARGTEAMNSSSQPTHKPKQSLVTIWKQSHMVKRVLMEVFANGEENAWRTYGAEVLVRAEWLRTSLEPATRAPPSAAALAEALSPKPAPPPTASGVPAVPMPLKVHRRTL